MEPTTGPSTFVEPRRREADERQPDRDPRAREAREREVQDREARDRGARQREARERDARERQARERDAREREARGREARERDGRERQARERDAQSREARELEARNRQARDREAMVRQAREREARERDVLGREAREREARGREAGEREAREREARRVESAAGGLVDVGEPDRDEEQWADEQWDRELQEEEWDDGALAGPPPAREARRFRGLAVPLVAAAVVAAIGYPLTALAVSRVQLAETPGEEQSAGGGGGAGSRARTHRVRLSGAVTYDGSATPIECAGGTPILVTFGAGDEQVAIRLGLPSVVEPGNYPVKGQEVFVAVTRLAGKGQTWSTRNQPDASGQLQVRPDRSVSAQFSGLKPSSGAGEGTVEGTLEMRCG